MRDSRVLEQWAVVLILLVASLLWVHQATAAPGAPTCAEKLVNGGFEAGATGWTQNSANDLISSFYPHSGTWGAYLGGVNNADDTLAQQVALPADAMTITLTAWWAIATEEAGVGFDRMIASLRRPDGALLADLFTVDSSSTANVWDQAELDVTNYRGQTVILQFHATTDASNLTDFYLDDISLVACLPPVTIYLPLITR
jgi:hypothetical protein